MASIEYNHKEYVLSKMLGLDDTQFHIIGKTFHKYEVEALKQLGVLLEEEANTPTDLDNPLPKPEEIMGRVNEKMPNISVLLEKTEQEVTENNFSLTPPMYVALGFIGNEAIKKRNGLFSHLLHKLMQGEALKAVTEYVDEIIVSADKNREDEKSDDKEEAG